MQFFSVGLCRSRPMAPQLTPPAPAGVVELHIEVDAGAPAGAGHGDVLPLLRAADANEPTDRLQVRDTVPSACAESQLRTLRPACRQIITEVLGDVPFDFYHTWFDALFLMSVVTTCALLGLHTFSVRAVKLTSE